MRTAGIIAVMTLAWQALPGRTGAQQADELRLDNTCEMELATRIPPRLSPDGKWLVCIRRNEDRSFSYYLVRSDGKTELRLHDLPPDTQSDMAMLFMTAGMWSPDGKKFLAAVPEKDGDRIANAAGGIEHGLSLAICDVSGMIDGKKNEPAMTPIARAEGTPFGGVFGKDGRIYWSSVNGLGAMKTTAEIRVFNPADGKDKKFLELPDFGLIYLSASPDRSMLGGLTMSQRTQANEDGVSFGLYERRQWVCRLADAAAAVTPPRATTRSTIVDGRRTFWSEDGRFFYTVAALDHDDGHPAGLFVFEPFQNKAAAALSEQQAARFKALIEQLGSKEWLKRESAYAELFRGVEPAKKLLEEAAQSPDSEIAERAKAILRSQTGAKKIAPSVIFEAAGLLAPGIISTAADGSAIFIDAEKEAVIPFKNTGEIFLVDRQGQTGLFIAPSGRYLTARINVLRSAASRPASLPAVKPPAPI